MDDDDYTDDAAPTPRQPGDASAAILGTGRGPTEPPGDAEPPEKDDRPHDEQWKRDEYRARKLGLRDVATDYADQRASGREGRRQYAAREVAEQAGLSEEAVAAVVGSGASAGEAKQLASLLKNAPADQAEALLKQISEARR